MDIFGTREPVHCTMFSVRSVQRADRGGKCISKKQGARYQIGETFAVLSPLGVKHNNLGCYIK